MYHVNKDFCISKIELIPSEAELGRFSSVKMKPAFKAITIPHAIYEISIIILATLTMYEMSIAKYCKRLNKTIKYVPDGKAFVGAIRFD